MEVSDSRSDDDDTTSTMMRAEGSTAIFDVSIARQSISDRRQSATHTGFSVTNPAKG